MSTVTSLEQFRHKKYQQIMDQTLFLYDGEEGKILIPKTQEASEYWGSDTRWCLDLSGRKEVREFPDYSKDDPLVIYSINKEGSSVPLKFLGHNKDGYLRDIQDAGIVEELPLALQHIILKSGQIEFCMRYGCIIPAHFAPNTFDEAFLLELIKEGTLALQDILLEERTEVICLEAVKRDGLDLHYVPANKFIEATYQKIYATAVNQNGGALAHVPEDERTEHLCFDAVRQNGAALRLVPRHRLSDTVYQEICLEAVRECEANFLSVPQDMRSEKIYLTIVAKKEELLRFVPLEKRTQSIYKAYIQHNFQNFYNVEHEIVNAPYSNELKRFAFEIMICDIRVANNDKKKFAADFHDVMTAEERERILGMRQVPPSPKTPHP